MTLGALSACSLWCPHCLENSLAYSRLNEEVNQQEDQSGHSSMLGIFVAMGQKDVFLLVLKLWK
jgi:hypothetical protein